MPPCPTCKKPVAADAPTFPFCNSRCKLADLGNWMNGRYVVASPLPLDESEAFGGGVDAREALARALAGRSVEDLSEEDVAALAARIARNTREAS